VRILHITPDYDPTTGGAELFVKEVSERLVSRGHDVTVLTMDSRIARLRDGNLPASEQTLNGVHIRRLRRAYQMHQRLLSIPGVYRALKMLFGESRATMLAITPCSLHAFLLTLRVGADVVSVFNWYHGSLAYQTGVARGLGRFSFVAVPFCHTERPWAHSSWMRETLTRCDAVATMTEHERGFVQERSAACARVVGAGIDPFPFRTADGRLVRTSLKLGDAPVVGYLGRMSPTKGVITLIDAMKVVWRDRPDARLLLAGAGLPPSPSTDPEVHAAIQNLTEAERSRLVTVSPVPERDKASIFDALDVFVMLSIAESFGISYLEAWMCRKPVIGARIPSTECVIDDGVDGVLVDAGDTPALARAITALLNDPARRSRLGDAGHEKTIERFTWDKVVDRLDRTYAEARAARA
jgi:glycosyltransferase involved in cell wall biosynthesis